MWNVRKISDEFVWEVERFNGIKANSIDEIGYALKDMLALFIYLGMFLFIWLFIYLHF